MMVVIMFPRTDFRMQYHGWSGQARILRDDVGISQRAMIFHLSLAKRCKEMHVDAGIQYFTELRE
jgi:hypothetical protein